MYKQILIAIDGSELSTRGLEEGLKLAALLKSSVNIITVSEPWASGAYDAMGWSIGYESTPEYKETREKQARAVLDPALDLAAKHGVPATTQHIADRYAADGILDAADRNKNDLIVMASHGRRGLNRILMGSQTQQVLTQSKVPVLVVR